MELDKKQIEAEKRERRSDVRIVVKVPVEIMTIDHKGCEIKERTHIEDVSDRGCRFTLHGAVRKTDTVAVRLLAPDGESLLDEPARIFEVIWIARSASIAVIGAQIVQGQKLYGTETLKENSDPKPAAK